MTKGKELELPKLPKEVETVEIFVSGPPTVSGIPRPKLGHIELEFGREDLNQLKDKLNEVIDYINTP